MYKTILLIRWNFQTVTSGYRYSSTMTSFASFRRHIIIRGVSALITSTPLFQNLFLPKPPLLSGLLTAQFVPFTSDGRVIFAATLAVQGAEAFTIVHTNTYAVAACQQEKLAVLTTQVSFMLRNLHCNSKLNRPRKIDQRS